MAGVPGVPGVRLPPRPEQQHPAYESVAPSVRRLEPDTVPIPRPPRLPKESAFPRTAPQWAIGIATIVTAFGTAIGGMSYLASQWRTQTVADQQAANAKIEARLNAFDSTLRTMMADQQDRDLVELAVLCELNGGPPAHGVRCPPNACEPRRVTADGKPAPGQPACQATIDWPPVRRAP